MENTPERKTGTNRVREWGGREKIVRESDRKRRYIEREREKIT